MGAAFLYGSGGPALNYKVVGGATQPASAKDNTIWVNTDAEITDCIFSATQPTTRSDGTALSGGEVWFKEGVSSAAGMNVAPKDTVMVYPVRCYQYVGGAWTLKTAMTYQNGAWVSWDYVLFGDGVWAQDYSVYSSGQAGTDATVTLDGDDFKLQLGTKPWGTAELYTNETIDLTDFSSMTITLDDANFANGGHAKLTAATKINPKASYSDGIIPTTYCVAYGTAINHDTLEVDLSEVTGNYYISVQLNSASSIVGANWIKGAEITLHR